MDFENLDRQFDQSLKRILSKESGLAVPYSSDPLAADHLMLQKSWAYFRERVRNIEDQWRDIAASKDDQIRLLKEKVAACEGRIGELEEEISTQKLFDEQVVRLRLADQREFSQDAHKLRVQWEEERDAFERTIRRLEDGMTTAREEAEARIEAQKETQQDQRFAIEDMRDVLTNQAQRQAEVQNEWSANIRKQEEEMESLKNKFDLIRQERDRLAGLLKESESTSQGLSNTLEERTLEIRRLEGLIEQGQLNAGLLKERIQILEKERAALQNMWDQEKAEWRELWDRARSLKDPS